MGDSIKKMNVLYVVNARIPNERAHGIQITQTCEALGTQNIALTLVTPEFAGGTAEIFEHYGIANTFTHKKIWALDIPGIRLRYVLRNFSFFLSMNIYILYSCILALFTQTKLVVYVRGEAILALIPLTFIVPIFFETHQIRNYEGWYKLALKRVQGIVVVTEKLKTKFIEEYGILSEKILVERDAVALKKFYRAVPNAKLWSAFGIPEHIKIVLYSGTLSTEKGVETLAESAALVGDDVQIVFLGGTEAQVSAFKEKYGGIKNISIVGRVDYTEVPAYVASADVLVLPDLALYTFSNLYTSPMKLFEYMATGLPIVAAKVSSLEEVLDEESAIFFESGNSPSLAHGITEALSNTEKSAKIGIRAREKVSEFTWEKRGKNIFAHLNYCLGHK